MAIRIDMIKKYRMMRLNINKIKIHNFNFINIYD